MIRHVTAVVIALGLSTSPVSAQTVGQQGGELTVKIAAAEVHKFPSVGSPVIGRAPRGSVLTISRNLGSWVEVPWPGGDAGMAFVHVNTGTIANQMNVPGPIAETAPSPGSAGAISAATDARAEQITTGNQPGPHQTYVSLPHHIVGLGARMSAAAPGFGGTARTWWGNRLGLQFEVSRYLDNSLGAQGRVTSFQFAPSLLVSLPDGISNSLWFRPYVGAGGTVNKLTLRNATSLNSTSDTGLGFQAFGGGETTFAGAPRFALSADIGYRWSPTTTMPYEPRKIGFTLSGHWYVK